ncbi:hypothetical protein E1176_08225 [Fulvivirga sp. RKSG066]|uniref:hypothetical protein n=1 Tax=Fulvivirga aurantia TaxID=2529383 RepID=UPI0012BC05EA|nr:hypothetical protein [Fulvivirga aurantia]MTI21006.1 hypothetical protein [Fulvivirga aurantia]
MKLFSFLFLFSSYFTLGQDMSIPIPEKPDHISKSDYRHTVRILNKVNDKGYVNYASYLQAALSYDALQQPGSIILDLVDKAFCEDQEATCRLLLHMDEVRHISFSNLNRSEIDRLSNRCYCDE